MKEMLSINDLIQHMKQKNIKFNLCDENETRGFLRKECFYFRVAAHRELYPKINVGEKRASIRI